MQTFFSQASAKGARSTALHALQWALGMLLASVTACLWVGAPIWLLVTVLGGAGLVLLVFLGAYVFLLLRNPDALRSENFSLSKMAIEKGLVGDSTYGLGDPDRVTGKALKALSS